MIATFFRPALAALHALGRALLAFVTFYRNGEKAFESAPTRIADMLDNRLKTAALRFNLPLKQLSPGEYQCQVTVIDPATRKAAFSQASVMVID